MTWWTQRSALVQMDHRKICLADHCQMSFTTSKTIIKHPPFSGLASYRESTFRNFFHTTVLRKRCRHIEDYGARIRRLDYSGGDPLFSHYVRYHHEVSSVSLHSAYLSLPVSPNLTTRDDLPHLSSSNIGYLCACCPTSPLTNIIPISNSFAWHATQMPPWSSIHTRKWTWGNRIQGNMISASAGFRTDVLALLFCSSQK